MVMSDDEQMRPLKKGKSDRHQAHHDTHHRLPFFSMRGEERWQNGRQDNDAN